MPAASSLNVTRPRARRSRRKALCRIAELYAIEEGIRGQSGQQRRRARSREAPALVTAMRPWFEQELGRVPPHSGLAEAIRYALARRPALCRFLDDGPIELDNNAIEQCHSADRAGSQEPSVRWIRRWRSPLGRGRLAHRFRQTQWHRPVRLSEGRPRPHEHGAILQAGSTSCCPGTGAHRPRQPSIRCKDTTLTGKTRNQAKGQKPKSLLLKRRSEGIFNRGV
jgi:hypothetical protein